MSKARFCAYLLIFCVILFIGIELTHSFYWTDDGFIHGFSWRVAQGEIPHLDFIYGRPALTPIVWGGLISILPHSYLFLILRLIFFIQMLSVPILTFFLVKKIKPEVLWYDYLPLAVGAFFLSMHTFPPMPWHTIDGVFWSYIAIFFLFYNYRESNKNWSNYFVGLFLGFSSLSKQGFVFSSLLIALMHVWTYRNSLKKQIIFFLGSISSVVLYTSFIGKQGILKMIEQMSLVSQPEALKIAAFDTYFQNFNIKEVILIFILFYIVKKILNKMNKDNYLPEMGLLFASLYFVRKPTELGYFDSGLVIFNYLLILVIIYFFKNAKRESGLFKYIICSLVISWAASISWGWITPLLGFGSFAAIYFYFSKEPFNKIKYFCVYLAVIIISCNVIKTRFESPYQDNKISLQNSEIGELFDVFKGIKTNQSYYSSLKELKETFNKYYNDNSSVAILPSSGFFWLAMKLKNPLSMDWLNPKEYKGSENILRSEFKNKINVVLLEKKYTKDCKASDNQLVSEVIFQFRLVENNEHWCVLGK